jgi:small GTP-binding protein
MTIGADFLTKYLKIKDKKVALQIWDFAGEERFFFLFPGYIRGASGGIFMFDITRMSSLTRLNKWIQAFKKRRNEEGENIPILIIGGKSDLHSRRVVFSDDVEKLVQSHNFFDYLECSAKTGENVEQVFYKIAEFLTEKIGILQF